MISKKKSKVGRPSTKPTRLKDGFYIEVRQKGSTFKALLRSESRQEMEAMIEQYERLEKEVTVLGQHKKDKWIDNPHLNQKRGGED